MKQAYDFALEHVGIDFHSTALWTDYIQFLKSEYVTPHSQQVYPTVLEMCGV